MCKWGIFSCCSVRKRHAFGGHLSGFKRSARAAARKFAARFIIKSQKRTLEPHPPQVPSNDASRTNPTFWLACTVLH